MIRHILLSIVIALILTKLFYIINFDLLILSIFEIIYNFFYNILKNDNLPQLIHNFGIALLTLLAPLAIALLIEYYKAKNSKEKPYSEIDLRVILDKVFRLKWLLLFLFIIFCLPFFWSKDIAVLNFLILVLVFCAIAGITIIILELYRWMKDEIFIYQKRIDYLRSVKNNIEFTESMSSVLKEMNNIAIHDKEYFEIFKNRVDSLLKQNDDKSKKVVLDLFSVFSANIGKRNFNFISDEGLLTTFLEWYELFYQRVYRDKNIAYFLPLSRGVSKDILTIYQRYFEIGNGHYFYIVLEKHIQNKPKEYINILFQMLFDDGLLEIITDKKDWDSVPKLWKITKTNLQVADNQIVKIFLDFYLRWCQGKIIEGEEFDKYLEDATHKLFPEIEPLFWSDFLTYLFMGKDIEYVINRNSIFGLVPRAYSSWEGDNRSFNEIFAQELKKTNELISNLFKDSYYTNADIAAALKKLDDLKFDENSREEFKRLRYQKMFIKIKEYNET